MTVEFSPPLAISSDYPPASIKVTPSVSRDGAPTVRAAPANATHVMAFRRARGALHLIAGSIDGERTVWLPAYHCPALVEPFIAAGLDVDFYPVTAALRPDLDHLARHHRRGEPVVGIRYFGFESGLTALADFCRDSRSLLIEDLAHAAFADALLGDVAVTSLYKFYPMESGAELLLSASYPERERVLDGYRRLPGIWTERTLSLIERGRRRLARAPRAGRFRYFRPEDTSRNVDRCSGRILAGSDHQAIVRARRDNFRRLSDGLQGAPSGRPLHRELEADVTPYVMPFLLDDAASFDGIRKQGMQVFRWEELAATRCAVSSDYRGRLIQIPVHQDLSRADIDALSRVVAGAGR